MNFQKSAEILTIAGTFLLLCACALKSNNEVETQTPDISYPGLSVYGLGGVPADEIFTPWSANVRQYRYDTVPGAGFITVSASKTTKPDSIRQRIDFRLAQVNLDTCLIITDGDGHSKARYQGSSSSNINLGPAVAINRPVRSRIQVKRDGRGSYRKNNLSRPLPPGAFLSFSSNRFPAVSPYKVADTEPPADVSPHSGTYVDVNSRFTWKTTFDPSSYMEILFYSKGANRWPDGYGMRCDVVDDGEFELPAEALELVEKYPDSLKVGYFRITRRIDYQDGIVFYHNATAVGDLSGL